MDNVEYRTCGVCGNTKSLIDNFYPIYTTQKRTYRKYCKSCYVKGVTPNIRIANAMRRHLKRCIQTKTTSEEIGCGWVELIQHLENQFTEGMSWKNWGVKGWHIDHIKPISKGGTNHYTNLQPLWWYDNLSKGNN